MILEWDWEAYLSAEDDENADIEGDTIESFDGCEMTNNEHNGDDSLRKKRLPKKRHIEIGDQNDDDESLYADSEFAAAIAKAAETSSSTKLKSSEIATKLNPNSHSKRKLPEGIIRPSLRNHPRGGRLAPIPDDIQVLYDRNSILPISLKK